MTKNINDLTTAEAELRRAQERADEVRRQYEDARKLDEEWRANRQKLVTLAADDEAAAGELRKANQAAVAARIQFENLELERAEAERLAAEAAARAKEEAQRRQATEIAARLDQLQTLASDFNSTLAALFAKAKEIRPLERQLDRDARETLGLSTLGFNIASQAMRNASRALAQAADDVERDAPTSAATEPAAAVARAIESHWFFTHLMA